MTGVLRKIESLGADMHLEKMACKAEKETRMMHPQAKEHQDGQKPMETAVHGALTLRRNNPADASSSGFWPSR
jgi:hypothetical protein